LLLFFVFYYFCWPWCYCWSLSWWCCCSCLVVVGGKFHLFPRGVGSWLQMQASNSDWNGVVDGGSSPLELDDDDEMVELRHANGCIQFYWK
jgi:hypothetical protein